MIENLVEKGYLIKIVSSIKKAENSIKHAENSLKRAKEQFDAVIYDGAFISAYTAMFHCTRALLFKDGYKERNHYVLYEYLKEIYSDKIDKRYINELNNFRTIRHKIIYGEEDDEKLSIREVEEAEAESAIKVADGFLEVIRKLIK